eukprot:CAMPEP_0114552474 /NCGR_PEP_ID=MMETSP0114-20121206/7142_1 /TAXON_ID=31324 /ORGANISM="Goniomonas sp, Strain m" /LENGTH=381 /DNA_ID=CAMNT_0001737349 /DNA_START=105 /DNA_END=1250 /DNA_ORIENTATION=-
MIAEGTRRIFSEEHDAYRATARRFFNEKVVPFHSKWEEAGECPKELWREAGETGLLSVTVPEEYGGPGADILYSAIVWEEQSYTGCTGPGFALHSEIVAPYLMHYGNEEQKQRILPRMVSGESIGAIAMTEPGAGSDLQGVRTTAVADGDDFIINGSKTFITNGALADVVIVVAKTAPEKGAHGISLFLVEAGMAGFKKGQKLKKLGLRAQDTSELFFEDVRVPKENLLGELNKGFYYLMQELPQERLLIADIAQSSAEACYEWTRTYVHERKAFGKPILNLQTIKHKMAEIKTDVSVGRAFLDQCLQMHHEKRLDSATASMAKMWCSELQNKVANECLQLHGGWGYMWDYAVCRQFADARVQSIYGGTNEIMKELIARTV